jgi:hypothetical protein
MPMPVASCVAYGNRHIGQWSVSINGGISLTLNCPRFINPYFFLLPYHRRTISSKPSSSLPATLTAFDVGNYPAKRVHSRERNGLGNAWLCAPDKIIATVTILTHYAQCGVESTKHVSFASRCADSLDGIADTITDNHQLHKRVIEACHSVNIPPAIVLSSLGKPLTLESVGR